MPGDLKAKVSFLADTKGLLKGVDAVEGRFNKLGKTLERHSAKLMGAGLAIGAGLGVAVKVAGDFDQALRNMASVAKPTEREFEAIHDMALKLGSESIHGPRKLAEVTYTLASAGMKAAKQMKVLPGISALAAGTQFELSRATNLTISALNQFGYAADETDRVVNVFAASTQVSQARMDLLEQSMREAGATAGQFGMDIEDVVAPLMAFYDKGVVATTAGTSFKNIILLLNKGTPELDALLKRLNLTLADVSPETHTVAEAFQVMSDAGATAIDMTKAFGQENALTASVMMSSLDKINKFKDGITGTKRAYEMAKDQAEGFGQTLALTKASLEGVGIAVGEVLLPSVKEMAIHIATAAIAFSDLSPKMQGFIVKGTVATTGVLLLGSVLGKILPKLGKFVGWLALFGDKIAYSAIGGLSGLSAGLVALGAAGAAAAGVIWGTNAAWEEINESIGEYADQLATATAAERESIVKRIGFLAALRGAFQAVTGVVGLVPPGMADVADEIEGVEEVMATAAERAEALVTSLIEGVTKAFDKVGTAATEARDPMAKFLTDLNDMIGLVSLTPLEKYDLLMQGLAPQTLAAADATRVFAEPLAVVGEQIGALSDPLITFTDEFTAFFADLAPQALGIFGNAVSATFSAIELADMKLWKSLKKAWAQGLKAVFNMFLDEKFAELAAALVTEEGKIVMSAFGNPLNLLKLAGLTAAYGTAKAALSGINSFDESAVITRGGALSGNVTVGDVIVSPDALKNFMKGGGGGRSVQVNVTFAGSYVGDSGGFRDDIDYLTERVALAMER